jgi:hypothetical protein
VHSAEADEIMTAIYSEERPDQAAPFHPGATGNSAAYCAKREAWEWADHEQRRSEHLETPWTALEAPRELLPGRKFFAALDTLDSLEIVEDAVCAARPIEFAHACEEEFARMLDAREISWQYKPRTFAVEWDQEGNFVDCFTPDFYLPANGVYIALIAPDRSASNAKTRHVKMLRRQHPEIRIELFHGTTAKPPKFT